MATNRRRNGAATDDVGLDPTNLRLLDELQRDARLSLAELGRRVGLSSPAVADRLARLEEDGVIQGYHARIDPRAVGFPLSAVLRIRPAPRGRGGRGRARPPRRTPEVVECHRMTGEDCYFLVLRLRSVEHMEAVIDTFAIYGQTTTSILQSAPVPPRGLALEAGAR